MAYKDEEVSDSPPEEPGDLEESVLLAPEMDRVFETLSARHRRLVLLLVKHGAVDTISDVLAREELNGRSDDLLLVHSHLPKLDDSGYIEWNGPTDDLSKGPNFDEIEPILDLIEAHAYELPPELP